MGELIGAKLPAFEPDADPSVEEIKQAIVEMRGFLTLLYERAIDPLGERGEWAEADFVVVTNEDGVVLDAKIVRVSVDNEPLSLFGSGDTVSYFEWLREITAWVHSVPGFVRWTWFHIHPEGMGQPSPADERKLTQLNAADLLTIGHLGGPRTFQAFIVTQRSGIVVLQSDNLNGIGPVEDALTSRLYAESYARVFGVNHPLTAAMNDIATSIEGFVETNGDRVNPLAMLMYGMSELMPLQAKLDEAKRNLDVSDAEFSRLLNEDYLANGPVTGRAERPALGFQPPAPSTEALPELLPGILSDLAQFNFDTLDQ